MAQTLQNLRDHITHALGGAPSTQLPGSTADDVRDSMVNAAGRHLYSMHDWQFKEGPAVAVDFKADQAFVDLPNDFGDLAGYQMTDGLNNGISLTEPHHLERLRSSTITVTQHYYWAALSHPGQASREEGQGNPRLEFWPTPSADDAGAVTVVFKRKWMDLEQAAEAANIPWFVENLLMELVRAYSMGWEDEAMGSVSKRLEEVERGVVCKAAKEQDGIQQPDFGNMRGGAIMSMYPRYSVPFDPVSGPSSS